MYKVLTAVSAVQIYIATSDKYSMTSLIAGSYPLMGPCFASKVNNSSTLYSGGVMELTLMIEYMGSYIVYITLTKRRRSDEIVVYGGNDTIHISKFRT